jgi:hypothetical protein
MILLIYVNFMVIYVKKTFYGQTDRRITKNHSAEAHKKKRKKKVFYQYRQTHFQLKTIVRNLTIIPFFEIVIVIIIRF